METPESIIWTGSNVDELEAFAMNSDFEFTVGSNHGRYRWYHRLFEKLSFPRDDKSILEIFPERNIEDKGPIDRFHAEYTDDDLHELYNNVRATSMIGASRMEMLRQLVLAVIGERSREYTPWHWTTAEPGDKIFADGTVAKWEDWFEKSPMKWDNYKRDLEKKGQWDK